MHKPGRLPGVLGTLLALVACGAGSADDTLVDERASDTHTCDVNATCTDAVLGDTCTCNAGFTGDGLSCQAVILCPGDPSCPSPAVDLAAGGFHSCAVREDGTLWCWGANAVGALGVGDRSRGHT